MVLPDIKPKDGKQATNKLKSIQQHREKEKAIKEKTKIIKKKRGRPKKDTTISVQEQGKYKDHVGQQFNEQTTTVGLDLPKMDVLIQPQAEAPNQIQIMRQPAFQGSTKVQPAFYGKIETRSMTSEEKEKYAIMKRLQKPIQPPARMGFLPYLEKQAQFF